MANRDRDPLKEEQWRRHLSQRQASGLNTRAYCRQHGLSEASFYSWRRELARRDRGVPRPAPRSAPDRKRKKSSKPSVSWLPVSVTPTPGSGVVEVQLVGGTVIRIGPGTEEATLRCLFLALLPLSAVKAEEAAESRRC